MRYLAPKLQTMETDPPNAAPCPGQLKERPPMTPTCRPGRSCRSDRPSRPGRLDCPSRPGLRKPELGRIRSRLFASLALLAMLSAAFPLSGQTDAQLSSIVAMAGVPDAESLDEQELERLSRFLVHPVEINIASSSRLVSSGLFTRYQAASIADYRTRNGDILSYSELAAVEGFGDETVRRLAPFISLRSRRIPGQPATDTLALRHDALLRCASRGGEWNWGMKYKVSAGEAAEASFAARTVYGGRQFPPASWSGNVVFNGRKYMGKLIVGDYAARFGQGLALWSGLSLSSLSRSSSFVRRPTGISPSFIVAVAVTFFVDSSVPVSPHAANSSEKTNTIANRIIIFFLRIRSAGRTMVPAGREGVRRLPLQRQGDRPFR